MTTTSGRVTAAHHIHARKRSGILPVVIVGIFERWRKHARNFFSIWFCIGRWFYSRRSRPALLIVDLIVFDSKASTLFGYRRFVVVVVVVVIRIGLGCMEEFFGREHFGFGWFLSRCLFAQLRAAA